MVVRLLDELVQSSPNLSAMRADIVGYLAGDSASPTWRHELESLDLAGLLRAYVNWVDGMISQRPREVVIWDGFWRDGRAAKHIPDIAQMACRVEQGEDLLPYVSHRPHPHRDRALNGYGLHHLHFLPRTGKRRKGNSNALLYVRVERHRMHFVLCGDHRSFDDGSLRQAAADYAVQTGYALNGTVGITPKLSAVEGEAMLRRHNVNSAVASGNRWAFPSMMTAAGTSIFAVQHVDQMTLTIEEWEPQIRTEEGRRTLCAQYGIEYLPEKSLGWAIDHANLYMVDVLTERTVFMVPWQR